MTQRIYPLNANSLNANSLNANSLNANSLNQRGEGSCRILKGR